LVGTSAVVERGLALIQNCGDFPKALMELGILRPECGDPGLQRGRFFNQTPEAIGQGFPLRGLRQSYRHSPSGRSNIDFPLLGLLGLEGRGLFTLGRNEIVRILHNS
jgi:hypothetical protein